MINISLPEFRLSFSPCSALSLAPTIATGPLQLEGRDRVHSTSDTSIQILAIARGASGVLPA